MTYEAIRDKILSEPKGKVQVFNNLWDEVSTKYRSEHSFKRLRKVIVDLIVKGDIHPLDTQRFYVK
jgi:hypothetical protein